MKRAAITTITSKRCIFKYSSVVVLNAVKSKSLNICTLYEYNVVYHFSSTWHLSVFVRHLVKALKQTQQIPCKFQLFQGSNSSLHDIIPSQNFTNHCVFSLFICITIERPTMLCRLYSYFFFSNSKLCRTITSECEAI